MKFLKQIMLIVIFTFLGELCHWLIPLPIPAAIYGLIFLFLALICRLIPESAIDISGDFLISLLPLLFIAPTVNLQDSWGLIRDSVWAILAIVTVTTILTFVCSGLATQWFLRLWRRKRHE